MSLTRSSRRQTDQSNKAQGSTSDKDIRQGRRITNSSRELNRNEEQTSPSGRSNVAMGRNQTTGSNIPGSEIKDRINPNAEQWNQTSRDKYPTSNKSSPTPQHEMPKTKQNAGEDLDEE